MTHENIAKFIGQQREKQGITGELDEQMLSIYLSTIGINAKEFNFTLLSLYVNAITQAEKLRTAYNEEHNKNIALNKTIEELKEVYKLGGRQVQATKVKNGHRYNKKQGSLNELQMLINMGVTDEQIMEQYGISRSTMWRWKKQLAKSN